MDMEGRQLSESDERLTRRSIRILVHEGMIEILEIWKAEHQATIDQTGEEPGSHHRSTDVLLAGASIRLADKKIRIHRDAIERLRARPEAEGEEDDETEEEDHEIEEDHEDDNEVGKSNHETEEEDHDIEGDHEMGDADAPEGENRDTVEESPPPQSHSISAPTKDRLQERAETLSLPEEAPPGIATELQPENLPLNSDSTDGDHPNHCYLPHELPRLITFLHDAVEVLRYKMDRYQVLEELVEEMAARNPGVVPWDLISSEEILALVRLRKCLDWDMDAVEKLEQSVSDFPETQLVESLRDKVVGSGVEQEADREVEQEIEQEAEQEIEQEAEQDVGEEFEQDWKRILRKVEQELDQNIDQEIEQEVEQEVEQDLESTLQRFEQEIEQEIEQEVEDEENEERGEGGEDEDDEGPNDSKGSGDGEDSIDSSDTVE
ncbi:hypothetical protein SLS58_004921 [Diplodia intermedia]|uniref:Uncharacterized protein n=1 Tax=Diplodia intermedia TaxID=856260 RepID=A0ABR3TRW2_9PEZI